MDFVPLLIAILFQPFDGFTLLGGDSENIDLYYYGDHPVGSLIQLQCMSTSGEYINFQNAYIEGQNVNIDFPGLPVRRALFSSILQGLPQACQVTTTWQNSYFLGACTRVQQTNYVHSMTFRLVMNGKVLNMWSADEELRFIADAADGRNIRSAAIENDMSSPNYREFFAYGNQKLKTQLGGGQIGTNGYPCYQNIDDTLEATGSVSFSYHGFIDEIDFFDFDNYSVNVEESYLLDKLGLEGTFSFAEGEIVLIDYENPQKWGVDGKYWNLFEKMLIKVIKTM